MNVLDLWEKRLKYGYHNKISLLPFRSFSALFKNKCQVSTVDTMGHQCLMTTVWKQMQHLSQERLPSTQGSELPLHLLLQASTASVGMDLHVLFLVQEEFAQAEALVDMVDNRGDYLFEKSGKLLCSAMLENGGSTYSSPLSTEP